MLCYFVDDMLLSPIYTCSILLFWNVFSYLSYGPIMELMDPKLIIFSRILCSKNSVPLALLLSYTKCDVYISFFFSRHHELNIQFYSSLLNDTLDVIDLFTSFNFNVPFYFCKSRSHFSVIFYYTLYSHSPVYSSNAPLRQSFSFT